MPECAERELELAAAEVVERGALLAAGALHFIDHYNHGRDFVDNRVLETSEDRWSLEIRHVVYEFNGPWKRMALPTVAQYLRRVRATEATVRMFFFPRNDPELEITGDLGHMTV